MPGQPNLFGTELRTRILIALALMEETFPAELARVLGSPLFSVQRALGALEKEVIVVSRKPGIERRFTLNPRYYAFRELQGLLIKIAEQDSSLVSTLSDRRTRPRRAGKEL